MCCFCKSKNTYVQGALIITPLEWYRCTVYIVQRTLHGISIYYNTVYTSLKNKLESRN